MLHSQDGRIHTECSDSLAAIEKLHDSKFVPLALRFFRAGFEAVRGADRKPYDDAGKSLAPAIRSIELIIGQFGEHVAGDTIARLYNDVGKIHSKIQNYEPEEVLGWLGAMEGELEGYSDRMSSMMNASIAKPSFDHTCEKLREANFSLERAEPLIPGVGDLPLAWVLVANRL